MLAICSEHQADIRERLELPHADAYSAAELLAELASAPAGAAIAEPELAAYALILHRALRERGLGALLEERCALCAAGPGAELDWLAGALAGVRELAGAPA